MAWFDLDEEILNESASTELTELRARIRSQCHDLTGLELTLRLDEALAVSSLCRLNDVRCEVVGVWSLRLAEIKRVSISTVGDFVGYDAVSLGHNSLLRDGYFARPDAFQDFASRVNEEGLLADVEDAVLYLKAYLNRIEASGLEPVIYQPYGVDTLSIVRVTPSFI